jgi:hypothetical protein
MTRFQTVWLRRRKRPKLGDVWVFCYRRRRPHDGKWVEATPIVVGPIQDLASKEAAWRRVKELQLNPNPQSASTQMTFGELALHYAQHDLLNDQHEVVPEETHLTILKCRGYLDTWILPAGNEWWPLQLSQARLRNGLRRSNATIISRTQRCCQRYGKSWTWSTGTDSDSGYFLIATRAIQFYSCVVPSTRHGYSQPGTKKLTWTA